MAEETQKLEAEAYIDATEYTRGLAEMKRSQDVWVGSVEQGEAKMASIDSKRLQTREKAHVEGRNMNKGEVAQDKLLAKNRELISQKTGMLAKTQKGAGTAAKGMRKELGMLQLAGIGAGLAMLGSSKFMQKGMKVAEKATGAAIDSQIAAWFNLGGTVGEVSGAVQAGWAAMITGDADKMVREMEKTQKEMWNLPGAAQVNTLFKFMGVDLQKTQLEAMQGGLEMAANVSTAFTTYDWSSLPGYITAPFAEAGSNISLGMGVAADNVSTALTNAGSAVEEQWNSGTNSVTEGFNTAATAASDLGDEAGKFLSDKGTDVQDFFADIGESASAINLEDATEAMEDFGGKVGREAKAAFKSMEDSAENMANYMSNALEDAKEFLSQAWEDAGDWNPFG